MVEKDFTVKVHLSDKEFCNGCPLLVHLYPTENSFDLRCNLFMEPLSYDVRRKIDRLAECFKENG